MAPVQSRLTNLARLDHLPAPANRNAPYASADQRIVAWFFHESDELEAKLQAKAQGLPLASFRNPSDDWQAVTDLCGHEQTDFIEAEADLPLTSAEIDHFRRNHRGSDHLLGREFLGPQGDLPSQLAELYKLYRYRARIDAEATLFVAQATGSLRLAQHMADLLAVGGFANGHECVTYLTMTYAISAALDTSDFIDSACREAGRRLALPIEHPAHLLKLTPDEINILATNIVETHLLSQADFLEKANLLAEARQDTARLPSRMRFATAMGARDLPAKLPWVTRLTEAYARLFGGWTESDEATKIAG